MIKEKRGEYDLWSMKMRQYIAITDHILWDIITNGDQATTDPASSSAPKTSLAFQPQEETMRQKPLTNCYLQDTYRHLLIFMMPQMQNLTGTAIKSKNFAMSIATMMSGQPVLDVLEFDDLYTNNLTRCKLLLTVHSHSDEPSYDPSLLVQASMHTTLDDRRIFCMQNMSTLDKMDLVICATGATKLRYTSVLKLDGYKPEISDSILEEKQKEQDPSLKKKRDELQDKLEKGFGVESSSSMDSENTSRNTNSSESSYPNFQKAKGFHSVPPPTGTARNQKGPQKTQYFPQRLDNPEEDLKDYAIIDSGCSGSMTGDKDKLSDFKEFKGGYSHSNVRSSLTRSVLIHLQSLSLFCSDEDLVTTRAPIKNDKDEAVLWHRRLGHVNFKNINKLVKGNLVRGLPSKTSFKLEHILLACEKRDETYDSAFMTLIVVGVENKLKIHKVKDHHGVTKGNGTEFKNQLMNEFCAKKGIKREYSIARTPQQNGVAERKNRTLIEAARTMLADSLLPIQFWAEAVNTACYVLNRVLVTKPQMKTPYEILMGRSPNISFMRPFGCSLTILNTLDQLGKFDGKSEEGYLLGYSTNSKGFRVYNRVTRKVQDCLHVNFLENQENQKGKGPDWMFDLDLLTPSMNYIPVRKENYANSGDKVSTLGDVEDLDDQQFIVHTAQPMHPEERTAAKEVPLSSEEQALHDELMNLMHQESLAKAHNDDQRIAFEEEKRRISIAKGKEHVNSTFTLSTANTPPQSAGNTPTDSDDDIPKDGVFSTNSFDDENTDTEEGGAADYNKMDPTIDVTSTPTLRIHKIHPQSQIIGKSTAGVQTRRKLKESTSDQHQALLSFIYKQNRTNHKDQQTCLFACFLSQEEPKKVSQALADESWVEAMQEELLQFKLQDVWVLCDLPEGKRVIGTKWVFRNKRDERGTIIKNKARLVAQGYRQEEGVDYDEVFAPVARIEAIRLFLAFASFMGFTVYQMDVKSAFLYGNITEEVYVKQPPGFEDPAHPNKVYRVVKALYGLHQAPRAWYERLSTFLLKHGYRRGAIDKTLFIKKDRRDIMLVQVYVDDIIFGSTKSSMVKDFEELMQKEFKMSSMGELTFFLGLQVKQSNGGIFLSQDKYVKDILNKFDFRTIKPASTPIEAHKSLGKDEEGEDVDVHTYRSMIGCLMYLTASRPDIMFAVCLCARFQVTPKLFWTVTMPGTTMIEDQLQEDVSILKRQVLWMQNQLLDYGFNFMNTEIHIDNESTICIVRNPVFHSKTKHIQIRHHFIRDCYEQRLINVVKVHTDDNVADLLTKGFDLARFNFLCFLVEKNLLEALSLHLRGGYPDLIGPGFQNVWNYASLRVINDVPHIRAMVAGKKILISEETIRADLLFDDANGVDCFPKQVIWDTLRDIGYEARKKHSTSPHSKAASSARDAQGTPSQSAAPASISQGAADVQGTDTSQGTASLQGTATSLDASQTSGGDEGLLDIYALNREVRRLKKQTLSQAKQIIKLKAKLKKLSKLVQPVVKHHAFWVESQNLKKQKRRRKKQRKKVSSVKMGRNKEEGTLSEEHYVQEEDTADPFFDDIVDKDAAVAPDIDRKSNETEVLERKSDETEEINIEEKEASNVKSGDTEELDLETTQSTARQGTITPRTLNFEDEAGPSSPLRPIQVMESEEQLKVAEVLVAISRPRGLSIPGSIQTQPQQSSQGTDPKDKGKGILVEEPKKKKLTLQQIRALETTNDEEVARKIQAEWDAEEERKRFEELKKAKPKTTSLAQERNQMMNFLKGQGYKNFQKLKYPQMKELYDKVQESIKDSFKDFIPIGSEKEREMLKKREAKRLLRKRKATISEEQPSKKLKLKMKGFVYFMGDTAYFRIDRDLYHLYRVFRPLMCTFPPTGLGLILLGDLTTIWETPETSGDNFWKNQEDWEIVRMLEHGMEVEDENETALFDNCSFCGQLRWWILKQLLKRHVAEKDNLFDAKTKG
ncbi:putative ribonuclease H-like domain-containing protein [Tanacetum coccineum]|uniref:Ribonuclease H-like domain-containing protein n=1 Tax=Tanacetum coccineum TaxID=301880 RepID=A0ABQ5GMY6_9ASTR